MKTVLIAFALATSLSSIALADDVDLGGLDVTITNSSTPTTTTTQGNVDVGGGTYVYGQKKTFQPDSIGDTNPSNTGSTTLGVGVGIEY